MRAIFFSLTGIGFLLLIAVSWRAPEGEPAAGVSSVSLSSRTPASTSSASRDEIFRLASHLDRTSSGDQLAIALAEHLSNFGADAEIARLAVESPAPLAQAVGLRMLAQLPTSGENLSALGNGLRHSHDPALAEGAVRELERYLGTKYETDAQRIVEAVVGYGDRSPAQHAAALARPFINEHSYDEFRDLLAHLDSGAEVARALRSALDEYDRRRR